MMLAGNVAPRLICCLIYYRACPNICDCFWAPQRNVRTYVTLGQDSPVDTIPKGKCIYLRKIEFQDKTPPREVCPLCFFRKPSA
jgi:hypothetical protein